MTLKPVGFDGNDLKVVPVGGLDPAVLPTTVVINDGSVPFVAAQGGVSAGSDSTKLATLGDVIVNSASKVWQAPVLDIVGSLPGSPSTGDRYILTTGAQQINQWSGTAWVTSTPAAGWTAWVVSHSTYYEYVTGSTSWVDISTLLDHEKLRNLAGGTTGQHNHLTNAQAALLTGVQAQHAVLAAPVGGTGIISARLLDASDLVSGELTTARGGLGVDASASNGYALWTAGAVSFSVTIPWSSLSGVPSSFTPSAHASTHGSGGSDPVALDGTQITTGLIATANGGTGLDGHALGSRLFLASPGGGGAWAARGIVPDDVTGTSAANQVLARKPDNSGNFWTLLPPTYPTVVNAGTPVGTRQNLNFIGANSITDSPGTNSVIIDVTAPGVSLDPVVAALVLG
jgi:hypothetical protein